MLYIRVDVNEKTKVLCQIIPELLKCLLVDSFNFDGFSNALESLIGALKLCEGDFGILAGRALSAEALSPIKLSDDDEAGPKVTLEPEDPFARNNILHMVSKTRHLLLLII